MPSVLKSSFALVAGLTLAACGSVPSHDSDGPSDLKNYDRTIYEQTSNADRSLYESSRRARGHRPLRR